MGRRDRIRITLPPISPEAEFPVVYLLLFLPSLLNRQPLPRGVFDNPAYIAQILLQSLLIFLLVRILLEKRAPGKILDHSLRPWIGITQTLAALLILLSLYVLYNFGVLKLLVRAELMEIPEISPLITKPVLLPAALAACLAIGWMEEAFFRIYAFGRLKQSGLSILPAVLLANLLFAGGHLYEGIPGALFSLACGLSLSALVLKGFTLYSLGTAHGLFNFLMIAASMFTAAPE